MKYAFIFDCDVPSGPDYRCMLGAGAETNLVMGISPIEEAVPLAARLASEGYDTLAFCGAFDGPILERIQEAAGPDVRVCPMEFFPDQQELLNSMNSFREYGILIQADGLTGNARFLLANSACNAKVCFVPDFEHALQAVEELFNEGIYFIECCGYFTGPMVREFIALTCGQIPIGGTGLHKEC